MNLEVRSVGNFDGRREGVSYYCHEQVLVSFQRVVATSDDRRDEPRDGDYRGWFV